MSQNVTVKVHMNNRDKNKTDDEMEALYKAVGSMVIQWGQAEQTLDMIVALLFHNYDGNKLSKRIPKMLDPKIKFIKSCFDTSPELAKHKDRGYALLSEFERLSSKRHEMIHGAIADVIPEDDVFKFTKLDIINGYHHVREFDFDIKEFPKLIDELIKLGANSIKLADALMDKLRKRKQRTV